MAFASRTYSVIGLVPGTGAGARTGAEDGAEWSGVVKGQSGE
jgi:hypothetical protein